MLHALLNRYYNSTSMVHVHTCIDFEVSRFRLYIKISKVATYMTLYTCILYQ